MTAFCLRSQHFVILKTLVVRNLTLTLLVMKSKEYKEYAGYVQRKKKHAIFVAQLEIVITRMALYVYQGDVKNASKTVAIDAIK